MRFRDLFINKYEIKYYEQCDKVRELETKCEVFFGDSYASTEELKLVNNYDYDLITIPVLINSNLN